MNNIEFVRKLKDVADNYKTLYVLGCIGAPMTAANKKRYTNNIAYNKRSDRAALINASSADTFGFDCVCIIKSLLWGWSGKKTATYGGAKYGSNGVPDIDADTMITKCSGLSTDFSNITPGEAVWVKGHIGVYIGDGLAIECTPRWKDGVQYTACNCSKPGYNRRNWTKHGKLPYIEYVKVEAETKPECEDKTETKPEGVCNVDVKVLKNGSRGNAVKALQTLLNGAGYSCGAADGIFGANTVTAVKAYQKAKKLTADGIVGAATWGKLLGVN